MKATLQFDPATGYIGTSESGKKAFFGSIVDYGASETAANPVETVLMAAAACSAMDVIPMLQKRKKTVNSLKIELSATRAETHPKVFTNIEMDFQLVSPDATVEELSHAIELSHSKYCSVSIMLMRSGCEITWKASVVQ
jgi:putative redox protein